MVDRSSLDPEVVVMSMFPFPFEFQEYHFGGFLFRKTQVMSNAFFSIIVIGVFRRRKM